MSNLTQDQLDRIVAEIDRLQDDAEFNDYQIKQILQQLDLPNELLEAAIAQVHERRLLLQKRQRQKIVLSTIAIMIAGLTTTIAVVYQKQQNRIARIAALQDIVTLESSAKPVKQFDRTKDQQVFYRVTLKNAPINTQVIVSCRWTDATGQIVHQSRYQTEPISRSPWVVACSAPLTPQSQPGTWTVKMNVEERSISDQSFAVK
ncbi:hypothetical protein [Leptolyngbya sp. NIES-2104]|uniref:hypothetical protein n=1 Tax=Leptolyngbya sp. NIES-2104 TaxID=1552121 RepID=UPI0006EC897D|nr:hypothetical protein [Leptolyngbya sp. NIES-2104]GAP99423.1 hypothetical protein NIES2104_59840 [Leptolyngbya sp. NIES-2104]